MKNSKIIIGIVILAVIVFAFLIFNKIGDITGDITKTTEEIKIPLIDISEKAVFYDDEGSNYFIVKATDGSIKTAFDACDVCGGSKGYRQEGNDMICNNCGRHFDINYLGEKNVFGGGCWPSHLAHTIEGNSIIIKKTYLVAGSYNF